MCNESCELGNSGGNSESGNSGSVFRTYNFPVPAPVDEEDDD